MSSESSGDETEEDDEAGAADLVVALMNSMFAGPHPNATTEPSADLVERIESWHAEQESSSTDNAT